MVGRNGGQNRVQFKPVDGYSLRRSFIWSDRDALRKGATGFELLTVADIAGHNSDSVPFGMAIHYSNASPMKARKT